jgi:methionyl aminopeptidase
MVKDDGWTAVTRDGTFSAHFEHSVAITAEGPVSDAVDRVRLKRYA